MTLCAEGEFYLNFYSHDVKGHITKCSISRIQTNPKITLEVKITETYQIKTMRCPTTRAYLRDENGILLRERVEIYKPLRTYVNRLNSAIRRKLEQGVIRDACNYLTIDPELVNVGIIKWK